MFYPEIENMEKKNKMSNADQGSVSQKIRTRLKPGIVKEREHDNINQQKKFNKPDYLLRLL